ncbi:MAG: ABC transporter ATP-binding protein [Phycisphaerales bacterium]|nr:ABC transporter ATP-binding protein [Phycisphaerales bacterium]
MIEAKDLRKTFGTTVAVDGLSLTIEPGEVFGLLGPNGAGKTTTIHMLIGALSPDSGDVLIDGKADPTRADVRKKLGIAPQSISLYDELTAEENLRFFGKMNDLSGGLLKERTAWAIEFAGLAERRRSRVKTFSGGMKRRLNLACALVHDPPIILMDEPTAGVDPQSRNHIFERIEALKNDGRTIVYTTHYMEEAQRLCDRVAIMDRGRILALDTVAGLIAAHGGQSVIEAELDRPPDDADAIDGVLDGTSLRVETDRPLERVAALAEAGLSFRTLQVHQPDLETVFLSLTGRRLRD